MNRTTGRRARPAAMAQYFYSPGRPAAIASSARRRRSCAAAGSSRTRPIRAMPWAAGSAMPPRPRAFAPCAQVDDKHHLTLVCRDLAELGRYAQLDNWQFRIVKEGVPGSFTFLLPATREVPRRLKHPRRSTIGVRVPDHAVVRALLAELGEPLALLDADSARRDRAVERPGGDSRALRACARSHHRQRRVSSGAHDDRRSGGIAAGGNAAGPRRSARGLVGALA